MKYSFLETLAVKMRLTLVWLLIVSFTSASSLAADGASGERSVLSQGFGVRALSLGGAYVSLANDADASFWNPASLARLDRQAFSATHARFFENTEINSASWGHNFDNLGALGLSFTRLGIDDITAVSNWVVLPQDIGYSTSLATLSYARGFGEYFSVGLTGKALYESLFENQDYGFGLDLGFAVRRDHIRAGLILRDFVSSDIKIGSVSEDLQASSQFGLALDSISLLDQFSFSLATEVELIEGRSAIAHLGGEAILYDRLALRGGVDDGDPTFGAGFVFESFRLDYGLRIMSDIGDTHLFGFSLLFGSSADQRAKKRTDVRLAESQQYALSERRARAQIAYAKAQTFESAGNLDSALVYYQLSNSLGPEESSAESHITRLTAQLQEQARQDSITIAESAGLDSLSLAELASQLAIGLAEELRSDKRFASALRVLDKARSQDPDSPDLVSAVSRIVTDRDEWKIEEQTKAAKARSSGDFAKALDMYVTLSREFPQDPEIKGALRAMGSKLKVSDLLRRAGRKLDSELFEEAKSYVERALTIDSTNVAASGLLERILKSIAPDESIRAISENADDWAQLSQALSSVREGKLKSALQIFDVLLVKYPHNSELLRNKEQVELRLSGAKDQ